MFESVRPSLCEFDSYTAHLELELYKTESTADKNI